MLIQLILILETVVCGAVELFCYTELFFAVAKCTVI